MPRKTQEGATKNIKKQGRPPKQQQGGNTDTQQSQFWFQIKQPREIVQVLGNRGQILFKPLSGKKAKDFKSIIENPARQTQENTYDDLKKSRQDYLNKLTEFQKKLLEKFVLYEIKNYYLKKKNQEFPTFDEYQKQLFKKLERYQKNQEKDDFDDLDEHEKYILRKWKLYENKNYFFIGRNLENEDFDDLDENFQKLKYIIDKDFTKTFKLIIFSLQNGENLTDEIYEFNTHKHLVSWALITSWAREGRELLSKLQMPDKNIKDQENENQEMNPNFLIEKISELQKTYEEYNELKIQELLEKFQVQYKMEIDNLIKELKQVVLQQEK